MSKPSKAEREALISSLEKHAPYEFANLQCDGDLITLRWARESSDRVAYVLAVYVNGWIKGEWMHYCWESHPREEAEQGPVPEIARRYYRAQRRTAHTTKQQRAWVRVLGKRKARDQGVFGVQIYYSPYWKTARSAIKHIFRHAEKVIILTPEAALAAHEALRKETAGELADA